MKLFNFLSSTCLLLFLVLAQGDAAPGVTSAALQSLHLHIEPFYVPSGYSFFPGEAGIRNGQNAVVNLTVVDPNPIIGATTFCSSQWPYHGPGTKGFPTKSSPVRLQQ